MATRPITIEGNALSDRPAASILLAKALFFDKATDCMFRCRDDGSQWEQVAPYKRGSRLANGWAQVPCTVTATAGTAGNTNKVFAHPYLIDDYCSLAGIFMTTTVATVLGPATFSLLRCAVFLDNGANRPGTFVTGTEQTFDPTTATGAKASNFVGNFQAPMVPGVIWVVSAFQMTGTPTTFGTVHSLASPVPGATLYIAGAQTGVTTGLAEAGQTLTEGNTLAAYSGALISASSGAPWRVGLRFV